MEHDSVASAPALQGAIALEAVATVQRMDSASIQAFRKHRLREAIDQFFDGKNVVLARLMRNKDGQPLKDGSYVGQLLKDASERGSRPIDEDRVREIEGLRAELKGWFDANRQALAQEARTAPPSKGSKELSFPALSKSTPRDTNHGITVPAVSWGQGVDMEQYRGSRFDALTLPDDVGHRARRLTWPDNSMAPELNQGDIVVVEYETSPLPNDIVICRAKRIDLEFPGRYIQSMAGGSYIEVNQPGFDSKVDTSDVDILAVVMYQLIGRRGRMPSHSESMRR
ncbi:MAG: S24 family peptidase [Aquabacterium sp.]|uniref:S24 family peptidase n=1 Tax=Aquabacterium sp. TaxID=1872578 RepID=UPI003BB14562